MGSTLPLGVLGLVAPVLSWVEGGAGTRLPWQATVRGHAADPHRSVDDQERSWLMAQLPSASLDLLDDVLARARREHGRGGAGNIRPLELGRAGSGNLRDRPGLTPPSDYDLVAAFDELGDRYFVWENGGVIVRGGRLEELHELSLRFPAGHLLRHFHAKLVVRGFLDAERAVKLPEQISQLATHSYSLRAVVERGVSEGHLHLGGVTNAEDVWCQVILDRFSLVGGVGWSSQTDRALFLGRCAARILALAVFLGGVRSRRVAYPLSLLEYLDRVYFARTPADEWVARKNLTRALEEAEQSFAKDQLGLDRSWRRGDMAWLARWIDPLLLRSSDFGPYLELEGIRRRLRLCRHLHFHAHRLLLLHTEHDPVARYFLKQALFRYVVLRTHHWQRATQSGRTTGLEFFRSFYGSSHRRPREREGEYQDLVLERLTGWHGLRMLEGRLSPPERVATDILPWVAACGHQVIKNNLDKFGLVVHFIKEKPSKQEDRLLDMGLPCLRFGFLRRKIRRRALRLYRLLASPNPVAPFIVGIDAASLELAVPPEVFAPSFRFLREFPIARRDPSSPYSDHLRIRREVDQMSSRRRLGMTYHVGEDFRHLLSGLRAIAEVIEFLKPSPGDRLGHAIALALDPLVWAQQNGFQAVVPKLEWLDTLVWVHHLLGPGHDVAGKLGLEDRIQKLSWQVFGGPARTKGDRRGRRLDRDWSPLTLHDAWRLRQLDPDGLDLKALADLELQAVAPGAGEQFQRWAYVHSEMVEASQRALGSRNACLLLELYWFNMEVRREGERPTLIDMKADRDLWLELCHDVEELMLEKVQKHQLVVEVNPAVNRFIGPMERLEQHHVFEMTLDEEKRLERRIRVTVNTDNPAVFNTSLPHQYYLLGEILMGQGEPEGEVVEWLDWLRKNGEDFSFVRQLPDRQDPAMRKVLEKLEDKRRLASLPTLSEEEKLRRFWCRRYRPPDP